MSSENSEIEVLDHYRNISRKLKKTFFKKPNENEALESYIALARDCETSELPAYAGLCWNAAAKCESSLGNSVGEVTNLLRSARQYAAAECNNVDMGCISLGCDNLHASLNSYSLVATKYEQSPLAVNLNLEIVNFLKRIGRDDLVSDHLCDALEHNSNGKPIKLQCLETLAADFIASGDYLAALDAFTKIYDLAEKLPINGANADILLRCEINRVLLLLIMKPPPQKITPELTKILERYTWSDRNDDSLKICKMSEYMFILLESLVTTCQSADTSGLVDLEEKLWPLFTSEQKDLLCVLVRIYYP
ncbi:hypothetical protein HHI36_014930 [Cryptolaemus montrouzieri]|uniref:Factor VIII intron 22 protein n=1 Tax=Cryptolaemus montrouzieri TaxID=559131 RepID=A0ABD2N496_9CUCU